MEGEDGKDRGRGVRGGAVGSLVHLPVSGELGVQGLRAELGFHGVEPRSRDGRGSSSPRSAGGGKAGYSGPC